MTTRKILIKKGFPYYGTDVSFERSVEQIKAMLKKHGCNKIAEMSDGDITRIAFEKDHLMYLIDFPITFIEKGQGYSKKNELAMRISGRIIHDRIKSLLVSVEIQYLEFRQAMVGYIALNTPNGPVALMERVDELDGRVDQMFLPMPNVEHEVRRLEVKQ